jgi:GGDEF domain-containing protein
VATSPPAREPGDILARHGGDEFVLLLPDTTPAGAHAALGRLRRGVGDVRWSLGISQWLACEPLDAPLARADRRLYEAKLATSGWPGENARTTATAPPRQGEHAPSVPIGGRS